MANFAGTLVREFRQQKIACMGLLVNDAVPRETGQLDLSAGDLEMAVLLLTRALYDQLEGCAGLAAQVLADTGSGSSFDVATIDADNDIAGTNSCFLSGTAFVGFVDDAAV